MKIGLILLLSVLVPFKAIPQTLYRKRTGKAEYCVITLTTIECMDHTMAQCLASAYDMSDAIVCLPRKEAWQE